MLTGQNAYTQAFNTTDLSLQWAFNGEGYSNTFTTNTAVCIKNANGYRVIVKPASTYSLNCYVLDAMSGEEVSIFQCGGLPIIHYDKDSGNADMAIFSTGQNNQILVTQMKGDLVVSEELWYGDGDTNHGFIVNDYFVTAIKASTPGLNIMVYDIFTGNVLFEDEVQSSSSSSYAVFGGLYDDGNGNNDFMIMIRVGTSNTEQFRAYTQKDMNI